MSDTVPIGFGIVHAEVEHSGFIEDLGRWVRVKSRTGTVLIPSALVKRITICSEDEINELGRNFEQILGAVSLAFDVSAEDIQGQSHFRHVTDARLAVMQLAHELTGLNRLDIARRFGLERSSCNHACRRVKELLESKDKAFCSNYYEARKLLRLES